MTYPVQSKIATLEALLKELSDASYNVLCESNGVSDNEWTIQGDKAVPEWPVPGFFASIKKLSAAWENARDYFEPIEAERQQKWKNACATASYLIDRFKQDREENKKYPHKADNHLQRNVADAIYGTIMITEEDRKAGIKPETIRDRVDQLTKDGILTKLTTGTLDT